MLFIPKVHEIYKHFKGNLYQITAIAEHTETGEQLVIYQALYGEFKTYARPLSMFTERVDREKYPNATQEFRFELFRPDADVMGADASTSASWDEDVTGADASTSAPCDEDVTPDPILALFLDAKDCEEKLGVLIRYKDAITDDMITAMAIASDVEVNEGSLLEKYESLKTCLSTKARYECSRLR